MTVFQPWCITGRYIGFNLYCNLYQPRLASVAIVSDILQDVVLCKIGCGSGDIGTSGVNLKYGGSRMGNDLSPCDSKQFPSVIDSKSKSSGFWSRLSFRNTNRSSVQSQPESDGTHGGEVRHGTVVSLFGRLSEVIIFMDSLIDAHVQSLYRLGWCCS